MLKPRKRLTKRQMKEDKFVTYYLKAHDFVTSNGRLISYIVGGIAVIILVGFIWSKKKMEKENSAIVELTKAKVEYFNNNYEAAADILKDLVENYGGTDSGKLGVYYLANAYFNVKNYMKAEEYFRKYLEVGDDKTMKEAALSGVAACLEEQGNYLEAAKKYKEAAEDYSSSFLAPQNLYDSARCFSLAGNQEMAKESLNTIIEKYSDSNLKSDAEIFLAELVS